MAFVNKGGHSLLAFAESIDPGESEDVEGKIVLSPMPRAAGNVSPARGFAAPFTYIYTARYETESLSGCASYTTSDLSGSKAAWENAVRLVA